MQKLKDRCIVVIGMGNIGKILLQRLIEAGIAAFASENMRFGYGTCPDG